jgi:hypothetical protein
MNTNLKLSTLTILAVILQSCGGGSTPKAAPDGSHEGQVGTVNAMNFSLQDSAEYYTLAAPEKNWIDGSWATGKITGKAFPAKTKGDVKFPEFKDGDSSIIYAALLENSKVVLGEKDKAFKLPTLEALLLKTGSKLTINGTKDTVVNFKRLVLKGDLVTKAAQIHTSAILVETGLNLSTEGEGKVVFTSFGHAKAGELQVKGTFEGKAEIDANFTLYSEHNVDAKKLDLINNGTLNLKGGTTLNVKSFTNTGILNIDLGKVADGAVLTTVDAIKLAGQVNLFGGEAVAAGKENVYTLITSTGDITGNFAKILTNNAKEEISADKHKLTVKVSKVVARQTADGSASRSMHRYVGHMHSHAHSFMNNTMLNAQTTTLAAGVVVSAVEGTNNFVGLNAGNFGGYAGYSDNNNMFAGAYSKHAVSGFNLTNSLYLGTAQSAFSENGATGAVKSSFFDVKSQFSKTFEMGAVAFSPKVTTGFSNLLSLEGASASGIDSFALEAGSKTSFSAGTGFDMNAKFGVVEAFASFDLTGSTGYDLTCVRDDGARVTGDSSVNTSLSFGFKAQVEENAKVFGGVNFSSDKGASFETGLNLKM